MRAFADIAHTVSRAVLLAAALLPSAALAEKSDREQPVNIEADRVTVDDKKKESVFDGNVTMTQGTLMLRADKVVVKQDAGGFNHAVAYGKPAYFKQKREGFDEYIEGTAERLEYDGKADKMQMFTNAEVHKGNDEVKGDYISYDANTEFYQVVAGDSVKSVSNPKGRVRATIQPPKKGSEAKPTPAAPPPTQLKPSSSLRNKVEE